MGNFGLLAICPLGVFVQIKEEVNLCTSAESRAKLAEGLPSIGSFNLVSIKRTVAHLLGAIGGGNIFDEYTKHDISHINEMLRLLDWVIPEKSASLMSATDWLMVVLGVYFHDLGMLVTEREYDIRDRSTFDEFKERTLFAGPKGADYRLKIGALGPEKAERFFYQEFVRANHAVRVRAWLSGAPSDRLGVTAVADELVALLTPFPRRPSNGLRESSSRRPRRS